MFNKMPTLYLIIISIIGWGVGSIFYKIANSNIHPIMVSAITTATYLAITPIVFSLSNFDKTVTISGVLAIVGGAILMGSGSLAYYFALSKGGAGLITATTAMYPLLTIILSIFFLNEQITIKNGIGIILSLVGLILLSSK
jgi:transporter family protein